MISALNGPGAWRLRPGSSEHDRCLQGEEDNEREQPGLLRDDRRYRKREARYHQLGGSRSACARPPSDTPEHDANDHGGEQTPARIEHLRPVGTPGHRQIDDAEAREHQPADRENHSKYTQCHISHRQTLHDSPERRRTAQQRQTRAHCDRAPAKPQLHVTMLLPRRCLRLTPQPGPVSSNLNCAWWRDGSGDRPGVR